MLTAISMYLGGEIVSADACDYESSRDLGLSGLVRAATQETVEVDTWNC